MSTIKDVARRTGLSLSTISKYLNGGNVREENRLAIDELDYSVNVFARSLKANRSMTIGVLLPTISSPFFGRVVAAMEPVLRRSGYECFVCSYDFDREQELKKLEFLARYHVDGIVYVPEHASAEEVRARAGAADEGFMCFRGGSVVWAALGKEFFCAGEINFYHGNTASCNCYFC